MGQLQGTHIPVLRERCLQLLDPAFTAARDSGRTPIHLDATVGLGGHAAAVLAAHPDLTLVGVDRDPHALVQARERLAGYGDRVHLIQAVYDRIAEVVEELGLSGLDGILFDLGVSSLQLDEVDRGFAYAREAPLDMRMDPGQRLTAEEVVNTYSAGQLARVLREYGEERFAARIAAAVVRERSRSRLVSSARLAELVRDSIPAPARRTGGHPAKRTFQALRIEVNGELTALAAALPAALDALRPGGRMVVMSYHSLEDRLVKRALTERTKSKAPVDLPFEPAGSEPTMRLLTRGAEVADAAEVAANPRSAPAKLRAVERIGDDFPGRGR